MSAIEYYLQNPNFSHLNRTTSYYDAELGLDPNYNLSENMSDNMGGPIQNYPRLSEVGDSLSKKLFEVDFNRNKDDADKFMSDNSLLKALDHVDIVASNEISTNYNNNSDFNYTTYNKSMFGFSSYDCKADTSQVILPNATPSNSTTSYCTFNPSIPDHYFSPPLYLPYNNDHQTSDRPKKRSPTITKKERRRTHSINTAFSALRNCIPNVPSDTKLSKIKTLRLATSYIAFLMNVIDKNDPKLAEMGFKADMSSSRRNENREEKRRREAQEILKASMKQAERQPKGRTGWPQQVWASELK